MLASNRKQALLLLMPGMGIVLALAIILFIIGHTKASGSMLMGGAAIFVASIYQVLSVFKETRASAVKRIIKRFYWTEIGKFVVIAIVFVLLMKLTQLDVLAFVIGILIVQMGVWFCIPIFYTMKR